MHDATYFAALLCPIIDDASWIDICAYFSFAGAVYGYSCLPLVN